MGNIASSDLGMVADTIGWGLEQIFDSGFTVTINDFLGSLFGAIKQALMADGVFSAVYTATQGIAAALIVIYFGMTIVNMTSKDMLSFEKMVVLFIQFFVAAAFIILLRPLTTQIINLGDYFLQFATSLATDTDLGFGGSGGSIFTFWGENSVSDAMEVGADGTAPIVNQNIGGYKTKLLGALGQGGKAFLLSIVVGIFCFITRIAVMFVATSLAVLIIARVLLSPIAVVQCFDGEFTRSPGMMYFKRLVGDLLAFGVIIIIVASCDKLKVGLVESKLLENLGSQLSNGVFNINRDTISDVYAWKNIVYLILPQLAAIGGVAGAGKLAREVVGAN